MKTQLLFLCLCCVPFILADTQFVATTIIDDFEVPTDTLRIFVPINGNFPLQQTSETSNESILGGERDLILVAESGSPNSMFSTGVGNGVWTSISPASCSGFSSIQYDGTEGSSGVTKTGLNCVDLTVGGATQFLIEAATNNPTDIKLFVYDNSGRDSSVRINIVQNSLTQFLLNFSDFPSTIDWTCIGAIELTATILNNAQFYLTTFAVGKQEAVTPSVTPTISVTPSRTPTRSTTATRTSLPSLTIVGPTQSTTSTHTPSTYITPSASPTPSHIPPSPSRSASKINHCSTHSDCGFLDDGCFLGYCTQEGVCTKEVCPFTCNQCSLGYCVCDDSSDNDDGVSVGLIVGPIAAVVFLCCVCAIFVIGLVVYKKKLSSIGGYPSSVSVYDTMIGDM